jgi:hypothetical protein
MKRQVPATRCLPCPPLSPGGNEYVIFVAIKVGLY